MSILCMPLVNTRFKNQYGDLFTVIGKGTKGIIIEYISGKVELVSPKNWESMSNSVTPDVQH